MALAVALEDLEYPQFVESQDRDIVKRRRMPLSAFDGRDEKLGRVHRIWESKRKNGLLPARRDIDVIELRPVIGVTHLVDVTDPNPENYTFRLYGTAVTLDRSRNYTNTSIGQYRSAAYRRSLIEDYSGVVATGVPAYHWVVSSIDYMVYSYSRLILPLAEDGRRPNLLMICTNKRLFEDLTI